MGPGDCGASPFQYTRVPTMSSEKSRTAILKRIYHSLLPVSLQLLMKDLKPVNQPRWFQFFHLLASSDYPLEALDLFGWFRPRLE